MKRQSGYAGFPAILLTFSLLLLVLAVGFVVGRVVVARAYLDKAPRFDADGSQAPEVSSELGQQGAGVPGRVYVPPPSPPREAPNEHGLSSGERRDEDSAAEEGSEESAASRRERAEETPEARAPEGDASGRRAPAARPEPPPQPREAPAAEPASEDRVYAIQVGVFASRQAARSVVDDLARSGFSARVAPEKQGSQELFRVVTGRYRSEYAARKAMDELRKQGFEAFLIQP